MTNGGLRQWHVSGSNGSIAAYILDGNGYMWYSGYNGYGNAGGTDTTPPQGGWVKSLLILEVILLIFGIFGGMATILHG